MDIFLFINILCMGIVLTNAILLIVFGSKILSTIFNGIFWLYIFVYLLFNTLGQIYSGILCMSFLNQKIHYYIPVFFILFILITIYNDKFKLYFLGIFFFPLPFIFIPASNLLVVLYHLITWTILIFVTIYFRIIKKDNNQRIVSLTLIQVFLIFLAVFPFIIINLILVLLYNQNFVVENILPPCLAIASFLMLFFTYNMSLLKLNHDYYANLDMLKKASLTEKKTIIEKITASLVHEIKNPITAIQSLNGQLLSNYKTISDEKALEYLGVIDEELKRTKSIIEEFLKIYKKQNNNSKENINLYDSIESIKNLLNIDLNKKSIKMTIDDSIKNKYINFNYYNLRQIFINLIYNAIDAEAKNIEIVLKEESNNFEIYFKDDGIGIDEHIQKNIFLPFFSTKLDGVGMGMVIIKEIMHDNGGSINLISSKKGETIFMLNFKKSIKI